MKEENSFKMDIIDTEIIRKLKQNGRIPYRQIAQELEVAVGTITNRIQKLEKHGIILGFELLLDYRQLGYMIETLINLQTTDEIKTVLQKEEYRKHMITAHMTTGEYNTTIHARFKDTQELKQFLKELNNETIVEKTNTQLIMETLNN